MNYARLLAVVLLLALPASAEAQGCEAGLALTPEGYCCWPGQRFLREAGGCAGAPTCPAGTVANGNQCTRIVTPICPPGTVANGTVCARVVTPPYVPMVQAPMVQAPMVQAPTFGTVSPSPTPDAPPGEGSDRDSREGFLFRTSLHGGYGHFLYLDSARNGGGPILGASVTFAYRFDSGLYLGGSGAFDPILAASGWSGSGESWGPLFTPGGYAGATVGYASGIFQVDGTIAFGGSGNGTGAGGFGLYVVPTVAVDFADLDVVQLGAILRPAIGILSDPNGGRPVVYPQITAGLSLTYR